MESMTEITDKFMKRAFLCPKYASIDEMIISRYCNMLRTVTTRIFSVNVNRFPLNKFGIYLVPSKFL